jgi:hypothetical protein
LQNLGVIEIIDEERIDADVEDKMFGYKTQHHSLSFGEGNGG